MSQWRDILKVRPRNGQEVIAQMSDGKTLRVGTITPFLEGTYAIEFHHNGKRLLCASVRYWQPVPRRKRGKK
jgi:hypothetical protein